MKQRFKSFAFFLLGLCFLPVWAFGQTKQCVVSPADIVYGYYTTKVWLTNFEKPEVLISDLQYIGGVVLPEHVTPGSALTPDVVLGMDKKKPFAIIRVPAYMMGSQSGTASRLSSFTYTLTEKAPVYTGTAAKATGDVTSSVLANGTWYKIAVTQTGFHKLDYSFLLSTGLSASDLVSGNLRVVGNGGAMLSENNSISRISDLRENAVWINDGGDNTINDGDYAIFYAFGTTSWSKDSVGKQFRHITNLYADTAYYFISFNSGTGLRVQDQSGVPEANAAATGFNYRDVYEKELYNPTTYAKSWYGESFSGTAGTTSQTFTMDLGDNATNAKVKVSLVCMQGDYGSSFSTLINGNIVGSPYFETVTGSSVLVTHLRPVYTVGALDRGLSLGLNFVPSPRDASATGYLDYIEINARRSLHITGNQLSFRDWETVGIGKVASFTMQGANNFTMVWDVTDPQRPVKMNGSLVGSAYTFAQDASSLHEYAAINDANVYVPKLVGVVPNQNLHGSGQVDYILVTYPGFKEPAERLAQFHRDHDHLRVLVATTTEIYNEFSSGAQDLSAIRDFERMFYKRAGNDSSQMPKYILLFGGASYDYKNRVPNNSNFVPTFEAANDSNDIYAYLADDFFGFLDDFENAENYNILNTLDIGVGRLPARNLADANVVVDKCINYKSTKTLGPWRLNAMVVADDNDGAGDHMDDAEAMCSTVQETSENLYNFQKVYLNGITPSSTPAGLRSPNANAAINEQIYKGTFLVNYNGHGNPQVWAYERILTQDDFNYWNNANMLPIIVTATCDFGQYDHPQYVSAAEQLLLRNGGGGIVLVTTTGAVYATFNAPMNVDYLRSQFSKNANGSWNAFGEACRRGKNLSYQNDLNMDRTANYRKFALLGDPGLIPDFPEHDITIDSIIDGATLQTTDSVKALGKYTFKGSVVNNSGALINDFNGNIYVSIFDKARNITVNSYDGTKRIFKMQDNLIYKGKVSVVNGLYSLTFIAPKDINYYFGKGKVSSYAENGTTDAAGADTSFYIGGFSRTPVISSSAPVVRPYINDSLFINGGITGANTSLYVILKSETGINVSGYGLGHNLTATLDGNNETAYSLNDYYETAPNTFQTGYVRFPLIGIANGRHSIEVKAWDVNNNLGTGTVDFMVVDGNIVDIENLGNYPNPFSSSTRFVFEHNHPNEQMDVEIRIFNAAGSLARTISSSFQPSGSRTAEITWDGTSDNGEPLAAGVYVYKLNIKTDKGYNSTAHQKLVIVR